MNSEHRNAGIGQGMTLVACAWLAVFASAALLGPVLPRMTEFFRAQPDVDYQIALVATLPALGVAFLSIPFGYLADRVGHRRVLLYATFCYGFLGIAPFFLHSLTAIISARAILGIAEAAVMTCSAALIGHLYEGKSRDFWYALQTGSAPVLAIVALSLGGDLGERDWREPFLVYGFGFVLFAAVLTLLREPAASTDEDVGRATGSSHWLPLFGICVITVFALSAFLITVVQTSFLLTERGIPSPRLIGLWQSLTALANPVGALLFGVLRWRAASKLMLCFALMAAGFWLIAALPGWQAVVEGTLITNLGCGMILPTLITWALSGLPPTLRGRGAGAWISASFLGQFLSPLIVTKLKYLTGSLSHAILCYALACAIAAVATAAVLLLRPSRQALA